jgi:hypothetical protein
LRSNTESSVEKRNGLDSGTPTKSTSAGNYPAKRKLRAHFGEV